MVRVLVGEVSDHRRPGAEPGVLGELIEQGGGDLEFDDVAGPPRRPTAAGGAGTGQPGMAQLPATVGDRVAPLPAEQGGDQVAGELGVHRAPPGDLTRILVAAE